MRQTAQGEASRVTDQDAAAYAWRVSQLTRLGLSACVADTVADNIDWHGVARLGPIRLSGFSRSGGPQLTGVATKLPSRPATLQRHGCVRSSYRGRATKLGAEGGGTRACSKLAISGSGAATT